MGSGIPAIPPTVALRLLRKDRSDPTSLSAREGEVLSGVASGFTNEELSGQLHLSVRTVESHRANIMGKLGLHSRADLVRYALDHGLLR